MNKYGLNDEEITNSLLINDKQRFIDKLEKWMDNGEYDAISAFFKSHANLENKIEWQKTDKDPRTVLMQIYDLMKTTKDKKKEKSDIKSLFKDTDNFKIIGEDDNFVYVAPLTWDACVFIDSYKCGGQGATWCIGWEQSDRYWENYTSDDYVFVLMMSKKNGGSVLEQLHMSGDIDEDAIYDLSDYDYEGGEIPPLKYPNDNKVMFQIDSSGYVTAWEQTDDFALFENQSMKRIIKECELGFEWDEDAYDELAMLVNSHGKPKCLVEDDENSFILDCDEFYDSTDGTYDINEYLNGLDTTVSLSFVGEWSMSNMRDIISGLDIGHLDLSRVTSFNKNWSADLTNLFRDVYSIYTMNLSCFNAMNVVEADGFLDFDNYNQLESVVVDPNCDVIIDAIKKHNEKNGANVQIEMIRDTSDQLSFDFGE